MQFLYKEGDTYYFMDIETYEQISLDETMLGENVLYLIENMDLTVQIFKGKVVGVILPNFIEVEVVETDPGLKGDTVVVRLSLQNNFWSSYSGPFIYQYW